MGVKEEFVKKGIRIAEVEEFLEKEFSNAGYSHSEIRRTPIGMRITVYADRPGLVIGRGGMKIKEITEKLKNVFGFDNPQLDVQEVQNPYLDASIVAKEIANAIEKGVNHRRICNLLIRRMEESGAVGGEIKISGKLSGSRGRTERYSFGYLKYCGEPAKKLVDSAKEIAITKPGIIGVSVRIMKEYPDRIAIKGLEEERTTRKRMAPEELVEKYSELLEGSIEESKKKIEGMEDVDYEKLLEMEKDGKGRKGMEEFLKKKIGESDGDNEDEGDKGDEQGGAGEEAG